ncbi:MAG: DUF362 domain-containing protein [Thermodesulfobacteriota bacterium]
MQNLFSGKLNRRKFLKWQLKGTLLTCAGITLYPCKKVFASEYPDIAVAEGDPSPATRAAVKQLGDMSRFVSPGQKVVIKPNMSFDHPPENATNTHPAVVSTVADMCSEAGASEISVLDNPLRSMEKCIEKSGIMDATRGNNKCSVRMRKSSDKFREVSLPKGKQITSRRVMQEVLDADVLISVPVAKHHSATGVSLSMKGMLGLIQNRSELHSPYDLHESIVDLCTLLKADLTIIDASRALTENGPSGPGKVIEPNQIITSTDMVAADAQAVSMIKWGGHSVRPRQVKHIRLAHDRKLGRMDIENLKVKKITA